MEPDMSVTEMSSSCKCAVIQKTKFITRRRAEDCKPLAKG